MKNNIILMSTLMRGLMIFLLIIFWPGTSRLSASDDISCLTCHINFQKTDKHVHAAMNMGCHACHTPVQGMNHPEQKNSITLIKDMPALCFNCHDESKFKGKIIMPPVAGGQCTNCHDSHQSPFSALLKKEIPELCYLCHNKAAFTKKFVHPPAISGCLVCHKPHAGNDPFLLSGSINDVCVNCHRAQAKGVHVVSTFFGDRPHPIKGIPSNQKQVLTCVSCHNPHSSDYEKLFPTANICQRCHKFF
jgi:predicted CXXCH cytochrome family protein